jgi:hypothetical protein
MHRGCCFSQTIHNPVDRHCPRSSSRNLKAFLFVHFFARSKETNQRKGAQQLVRLRRMPSQKTCSRRRHELAQLGAQTACRRHPCPCILFGIVATGFLEHRTLKKICRIEIRHKNLWLVFKPHRSAAEPGALSRIRSLCCLSPAEAGRVHNDPLRMCAARESAAGGRETQGRLSWGYPFFAAKERVRKTFHYSGFRPESIPTSSLVGARMTVSW